MGRHPLFLPRTGELDAGEPSPRNVGSSVGQLALAGNCAATPKRHSPAILLQSSFARNQATSSGRARARALPPPIRSATRHYGGAALSCTAAQSCRAQTDPLRLTTHASAAGFDIHGRSMAAPTTASIAPSPHSPRPAYCSAMRRANGALNPAGIRGPRWPQRLTSAPRPVARSCIATALPLTPCRALALDEPIGVDPMGVISIAIRVFAQRRHQR